MTETIAADIPVQKKAASTSFVRPDKRPLPESSAGNAWFSTSSEAGRIVEQLTGGVPAALTRQAKRVAGEIIPLYLQALSGKVEMSLECRARLRFSGAEWASTGLPLEDLLAYFSDLTSGVTAALLPRAQPATRLSVSGVLGLTNQITREFVIGAGRARLNEPPHRTEHGSRNPAADLLAGRRPPAEAERGLAARYLIVVVRPTPDRAHASAARTLRIAGGDGTFVVAAGTETIALVPEHDPKHSRRLSEDLDRLFGGQAWIAVSERDRAAIPDGRREAAGILDLVCASQRPPQVYRLDHVLLEYAALCDDEVSRTLSTILEPLIPHAMLYETLAALVRSDFNRNATAKDLFIHRSTMDYRLDRIRELTGHDPMSGFGIQIFSTAIALHAITKMSAHQA